MTPGKAWLKIYSALFFGGRSRSTKAIERADWGSSMILHVAAWSKGGNHHS